MEGYQELGNSREIEELPAGYRAFVTLPGSFGELNWRSSSGKFLVVIGQVEEPQNMAEMGGETIRKPGAYGLAIPRGAGQRTDRFVVAPIDPNKYITLQHIPNAIDLNRGYGVRLDLYNGNRNHIIRSAALRNPRVFINGGFDLDSTNPQNNGLILTPGFSQYLYDFQIGQRKFETTKGK